MILTIICLSCLTALSTASYFCSSLYLQDFLASQKITGAMETKLYLVYLAKSQLKNEADLLSTDYEIGAKYVWQEKQYYFVVHSAYENENDAQLVVKKLESQLIDAKMIEIKFPEIYFEEMFSQNERNLVIEVLSEFFITFRFTSDLAVGLQTSVYSSEYVIDKLETQTKKLEKIKSTYYETFKDNYDNKLIILSEYFADMLEVVSISDYSYNALLKTSIEILEIYKNLAYELN